VRLWQGRHRGAPATGADRPSDQDEPEHPQDAVGGAGAEAVHQSTALREAWRLYGEGKLEKARQRAMPEAVSSPEDPEPAYLLGMIFKAEGDDRRAARAFAAVTRMVSSVADQTRAEMLHTLAQANLALLNPNAKERDSSP
jgi:TolA-binding protein